LPSEVLKGTAFRPSVITAKQLALATEGHSLSWKEFPQRLKPIKVARVMYELKLVPFTP
jgi:hypothetical protein